MPFPEVDAHFSSAKFLKYFEKLMATILTMVSNVHFDVLAILATFYH